MPDLGLIIVHTGNGKGKTTAALGMALRAAGHGLKTLMIQFIKGSMLYGELDAAKRLAPLFTLIPMGKGFVRPDRGGPREEDVQAVREAWAFFLKEMESRDYYMIILDEITYAMHYGMLSAGDVVDALENRPDALNVVLTGRDAPEEIVEVADLVTEMREIKHPFQKGIVARKGIEF